MDFILESTDLETLRKATILDSGEYNPLSKWLNDKYGITVCNTPPELDFDYAFRENENLGQFDFIFAFEILEHLMNPLVFLQFLHHHLKDDGTIFLSTPFSRPRFLWSKYHFTEYFPDKIEALANKAGFRVQRYKVKKVYAYRSALFGIRPIFRALWFERIMFFEMEKSK
jgi:SAM-dependent methyltransferase